MKHARMLLAAAFLLAPGRDRLRGDAVDDAISAEMKKRWIPGLSLAIIHEGRVVKTAGYGLADVEAGTAVTADTVYSLGTASRQFAAAAILRLAEEGRLRLDDEIARHLDGVPESWRNITLRHLLASTSGIPDYYNEVPEEERRSDRVPADFIRRISARPADAPPGRSWTYSNSGYALLGLIIEREGKRPYGEILEERFFRPLGMESAGVDIAGIPASGRARGHHHDWRSGSLLPCEPHRSASALDAAAGGIHASVADLARWEAAVDAGSVLKSTSLDAMWTPQTLDDGTQAPYGLGCAVILAPGGRRLVMMESSRRLWPQNGFSAATFRSVRDRLLVVVLCNLGRPGTLFVDAGALARRVARIHLPALGPILEVQPGEGEDPQITGRLRQVLTGAVRGSFDPELLTAQTIRYYSGRQWEEMRSFLSGLGKLESFTFLDRPGKGGRAHRYRAVFSGTPILFTYGLSPEGKVAYTDWWDE